MSAKLFLMILMMFLSSVMSSEIQFEAVPSTIQHLVTEKLEMKCSLRETTITRSVDNLAHKDNSDAQVDDDVTYRTATASHIKYVTAIVFLHNNNDLASISAYAPAKVYHNTTSIEVRGQVVANGSQLGYLEVSWTNPGPDQNGTYSCEVSGFDERGHPLTVAKTIEVHETEVTIRDLVKYINDIKLTNHNLSITVEALQTKDHLNTASIANLTNIINKYNSSIEELTKNNGTCNNALIVNLSNTINKYNSTIEELESKDKLNAATIQNMNISIQNFAEKDQANSVTIGDMNTTIQNMNISIQKLAEKDKVNSATIQRLTTKDNVNSAAIASLTNTINECNSTIQNIAAKTQVNTSTVANMNSNIVKNTNNINTCNNNIASLNNKITLINNAINTNTNSINTYNTNLAKLTTKVTTSVIFNAWLDGSVTLSPNNTVIFSLVNLNIGNGYNRATGIFTCPVAGIYLFTVSLVAQFGEQMYVVMRHNTDIIAVIFTDSHTDTDTDREAASNSVIVHLDLGDTVDVIASSDSYLTGWYGLPVCTFTGHLVSQV